MQGLDIGDGQNEEVDINELHIGDHYNDIADLKGRQAEREGFGIDFGLGFEQM